MKLIKQSLLVLLAVSVSPAAQSATASWTPKDGSQLSFIVRSGDKPAGTLVFNFSQANDRIVETRTEHLEISKLLIKAVFDQTAETTWHDQALESFNSHGVLKSTIKDTTAALKVIRQANGKLLATDQDSSHEVPAEAWPLALWNRATLSHAPLFDLTRAVPITVSGVSKGFESVSADGGTLSCERFDIKTTQDGKSAEAVVWYDSSARLCAMTIPTAMGQFDYVRTSVK